ncbi:MAG: type IV pilus assembly protein PilM [Candidatus Hydrogenedentes bacterium]|nr:type IV pilus assembly protein PilM [Candidatus Hydrogenedentota bacterium]
MLFTKPKRAIGLDIGTHSVKAVQMSRSGGRLCVDQVGYAVVNREQVNADPVSAHAVAVQEALASMAPAQSYLVAALPGQTVVIRYPRLKETDRENLAAAVQREAGQNIPYDLDEVELDWTLLDEVEEGSQRQLKVLLVAARHEVIDSRVQIMEAASLQFSVLGVDSLALADAAEGCDLFRTGETVALVNIGLTSASIHFVKDGVSTFIRDVNWGGRELIQAIAKEYRCEYKEAEKKLETLAHEEPEAKRQPTPSELPPLEMDPDFMSESLSDAGGDTVSDVGFGGLSTPDSLSDPFGEAPRTGGLLDPLDEELGEPMLASPLGGSSVELGGSDEKPLKEVISAPLSRMVSEVRRSFDYYEHQLYERPVDRLILSGGVAHLPIIGKTLLDELGVETVEVADPTSGPIVMGDDRSIAPMKATPAQYMVALGLAARGMADL